MSVETNKEEYVVMFEEVKLCEVCNNEVIYLDNFCNICGAKVEFDKLKPHSRKASGEIPLVYDGFYFSQADCLYGQHNNESIANVIKTNQIIQLHASLDLYPTYNVNVVLIKINDNEYGFMPIDQFRLLFTYMPNYKPDEVVDDEQS